MNITDWKRFLHKTSLDAGIREFPIVVLDDICLLGLEYGIINGKRTEDLTKKITCLRKYLLLFLGGCLYSPNEPGCERVISARQK